MIFRFLYKRSVIARFRPYLTPEMLRELETGLGKTSEWQALQLYLFPERTLQRMITEDPNALNSLISIKNTTARILAEAKAKEQP